MNILLGIPTAGTPAEPFLTALGALQIPPATAAFDRITVVGNFIPGQRELAARRAVNLNADLLIMIDDDMIVPADALVRMVDALTAHPQLAVVGALYYSRDGIHPMVADRWTSHNTTTATIPAYTDSLTRCDAVGFGCVALRVAALRSIPAPYFNTQVYVEESAARVRICNEDYLFCEAIRAAGWHVALDAGIRCRHYDRGSQSAFPLHWEDAATTATERMLVAEPGPRYRVVPVDAGVGFKPERHEVANIDYIIVE